jgi:hypothetical protein
MEKRFALAALFILLLFFLPFQGAAALTLSPPLLELGADPGSSLTSKIKVFNETRDTLSLYLSTANFTARDELGNPDFLFEEKEGLASWIEINPGPIVLLPGEWRDVPFTINVPKEAEAGGYYAAIFFSSAPPQSSPTQEGGQVAVVSKVGTLLLLKVSGEINFDNAVLEFRVLNDQKFFTQLPVKFWYRLRNNGNLHIRPVGYIDIKNIFILGSRQILANPIEGAVLPNSVRKFESVWRKSEFSEPQYRNFFQYFLEKAKSESKNFAFGYYTATLFLTNISDNPLGKVSFWVFPWHFLTLLAIFLIIAILILTFLIKSYNRWIIKRAKIYLDKLDKLEKEKNKEKENVS